MLVLGLGSWLSNRFVNYCPTWLAPTCPAWLPASLAGSHLPCMAPNLSGWLPPALHGSQPPWLAPGSNVWLPAPMSGSQMEVKMYVGEFS